MKFQSQKSLFSGILKKKNQVENKIWFFPDFIAKNIDISPHFSSPLKYIKTYMTIRIMNLNDDYIEQIIEYNLSFNLSAKDTIKQLIKDGIEVSDEIILYYFQNEK